MNWRDVLGQIAQSGKFKFKDHFGDEIITLDNVFRVEWKIFKLIARPVSDMSDEEKRMASRIEATRKPIHLEIPHVGDETQVWTPEINLDLFQYLLSRGILPEAFADEDVIWRGKGA